MLLTSEVTETYCGMILDILKLRILELVSCLQLKKRSLSLVKTLLVSAAYNYNPHFSWRLSNWKSFPISPLSCYLSISVNQYAMWWNIILKFFGLSLTGRYVAPEVFKNEEYDTKVDVFSFALILQEVKVSLSSLPRLTLKWLATASHDMHLCTCKVFLLFLWTRDSKISCIWQQFREACTWKRPWFYHLTWLHSFQSMTVNWYL